MSIAISVPMEESVPSVPSFNLSKLLRQRARELEIQADIKAALNCEIIAMPVSVTKIPYAVYRDDTMICYMDFRYVEGIVVQGAAYSIEHRIAARQLADSSGCPVYLVLATDSGIYWVDLVKPHHSPAKIAMTYVTEDTKEVIPFVYFDISQFGRMELDSGENLILIEEGS